MHYLLDTNAVSQVIRKSPMIYQRLKMVDTNKICISVITEAEILAGLAKNPQATRLAITMTHFLNHSKILPWDSQVAQSYADLYVFFLKHGKALSTMDALIAAHAHAVGATLVTADKAFSQITDFVAVEDWTKPIIPH